MPEAPQNKYKYEVERAMQSFRPDSSPLCIQPQCVYIKVWCLTSFSVLEALSSR